MILLVIALGATSLYFYKKVHTTPEIVSQEETKDLVSRVGKLMVLPEGETPTIATVSDPSVLQDQVFFADAEKGDKVLIYANAKKAILYSPTLNKIITIAPLNIGSSKKADQVSTQPVTQVDTKTVTAPKKK